MKPLVVCCNACNRAEFQIVGDGTLRCFACGTMFSGIVLRTAETARTTRLPLGDKAVDL